MAFCPVLCSQVHAGDLLYLPCGWWHAVRGSAAPNLSINWWFDLHPQKEDTEVREAIR